MTPSSKKTKVKNKKSSESKAGEKASKKTTSSVFKLRPVLDISYAERFKKESMDILEKSSGFQIEIDASEVSRLTTPSIQVLISLLKSCEMAKISIKIISKSDQFSKALTDLGLNSYINKWSV
jgi:anti-anti-sigma regulatory factor